jgi:hypothetical protein
LSIGEDLAKKGLNAGVQYLQGKLSRRLRSNELSYLKVYI